MRVLIPRAVLSTSAAGGSRRNKWWWWWWRHGEVGRNRVWDSSAVGLNRRWWVFNGSPGEPWSLSVAPLQEHITTTWTSAGAHAVTALCCCLRRIKRGHAGVLLYRYALWSWPSDDDMNLKPLLSKPPQQGDAQDAAASVAISNSTLHLYYYNYSWSCMCYPQCSLFFYFPSLWGENFQTIKSKNLHINKSTINKSVPENN